MNPAYGQFCTYDNSRIEPRLDYRTLQSGSWLMGVTYNYQHLNRLVLGSTVLEDESRQRSTRTLLIRVGYGLTDRWLLMAILSMTYRSVEIRLPTIGREKLITRGIGDSYLLAGYNIIPWTLPEGKQLIVGGGIKLPTGANDVSSDDIAVRYDMQPGTGAFDLLAWGDGIYSFNPESPAHLRLKSMFRLTTADNHGIKAGNEIYISAGILFLPEFVGRLTSYLAYRDIGRYKDNGSIMYNTGGRWLFLGWNVLADIKSNLLGDFTMEMPLTQRVEGRIAGETIGG